MFIMIVIILCLTKNI